MNNFTENSCIFMQTNFCIKSWLESHLNLRSDDPQRDEVPIYRYTSAFAIALNELTLSNQAYYLHIIIVVY